MHHKHKTDTASGHRDSACSHCAVDTVTEDSRGLLPSRPCACVTYGENPVAADADCSRIHFGYPPKKNDGQCATKVSRH